MTERAMPPLWEAYPEFHPYSMGWRMGGGEDYAIKFHAWWKNAYHSASLEDRLEYLRRHPFPAAWTLHALLMLWNETMDDYLDTGEDEDFRPLFDKSSEFGFPDFDAYVAD